MATHSSGVSPSPMPDFISPTSQLSPTLSASARTSRSIGRPKRSPVWDYFAYDGTQGKSICQIGKEGSDVEGKRGHHVAGKFPTNLKQHLKKSHAKEYKEMEEKEAENEKRKLEKKQRASAPGSFRMPLCTEKQARTSRYINPLMPPAAIHSEDPLTFPSSKG